MPGWDPSEYALEAGNVAEAFRLFRDAFSLDRHSGGLQQKMSDATAFLWRAELAGHPRDTVAWRAMYDNAGSALPRPGNGLADLHIILAQAVSNDDGGSVRAPGRWRNWHAKGDTHQVTRDDLPVPGGPSRCSTSWRLMKSSCARARMRLRSSEGWNEKS